MQLIGEVYDIIKQLVGLSNEEMATLFTEWNKGELESYLIEITATILSKKDDLTDNGYVVDKILDKTGMKGTGTFLATVCLLPSNVHSISLTTVFFLLGRSLDCSGSCRAKCCCTRYCCGAR